MEKRIQSYVDTHMQNFKDITRSIVTNEEMTPNEKLEKIYAYERCVINLESFIKKKRVRNIIPHEEKCVAYRANKERCTRRKKDGHDVCGTHLKGTPHGKVTSESSSTNIKKKDVWTQDIGGIIYYIDNENNVYDSNDIMKSKVSPTVIGKCRQNSTGQFELIIS